MTETSKGAALSDADIENCIDNANRKFNSRRQGPSGQQMTTYDDWKHWLAREVEQTVRAADLPTQPQAEPPLNPDHLSAGQFSHGELAALKAAKLESDSVTLPLVPRALADYISKAVAANDGEPFDDGEIWAIVIEACAETYQAAQPQAAEPALDHVECENCGKWFECLACGSQKPELHFATLARTEFEAATLPPLPEPAYPQQFYCNKCGSFPHTLEHMRRDGSPCQYLAVGDGSGHKYSADQMRAYADTAIAAAMGWGTVPEVKS